MKNISAFHSHGGPKGHSLEQGLFENSDMDKVSRSVERRQKRGHSRYGRRRFWGLLLKGKSLYVRGAEGQVYSERVLRPKYRTRILRLFYRK